MWSRWSPMGSDDMLTQLVERHYHPIILCEGSAERVIVQKLLDADALRFPKDEVVDVVRRVSAANVQNDLLNFDFDWPVCLVRIADSRHEAFKLGRLYADRFPVVTAFTHPEIEVLAIIRQGEWERWHKRKSKTKPSDYCSQQLGMKGIKRTNYLEEYWDAPSIIAAAREYRRLSHIPRGEYSLDDLIRPDA